MRGAATLVNRRKKFSVVAAASSSARHAFQFRQHRGGVHHKGRLVGLAPVRHRRQKRRVGLHQQPVQRHGLDDIAQGVGILEGGDAGDRNIKPQLQRRIGQLLRAGEAMDQAGEGALAHFVAQNRDGVVIGVAGMDDHRQPGLRAPPRYGRGNCACCGARGECS